VQKEVEKICTALDALGAAALAGWSNDQTLSDLLGWNFPVVNRHDIAGAATRLAAEIRAADISGLDASTLKRIADVPMRLQHLQSQVIQHLYNGNGHQAYLAYMGTLQAVRDVLAPHLEWQRITDNKTMPAAIARRLKYLQTAVDQINPDRQKLEQQIREIQEAHSVAESLPVDLQALTESRERVARLAAEANTSASAAEKAKADCDAQLQQMRAAAEAADKLKAQCEEAFRITTTKGLSAAFDQRAKALATSMWWWVGGLALSLAIAVYLGAERVTLLNSALTAPTISWGTVWMHLLLSLASVAAPVWFAWLSTKQIGQRFRLAEDYAFKASVAKSYEGYRREAAELDEDFSARLFDSALTRLEEAPLRLVETHTHGSPWQEFAASDAFKRAMEVVPGFKERLLQLVPKASVPVTQPSAASSADESTTPPATR
jgi:hypothetical protein